MIYKIKSKLICYTQATEKTIIKSISINKNILQIDDYIKDIQNIIYSPGRIYSKKFVQLVRYICSTY